MPQHGTPDTQGDALDPQQDAPDTASDPQQDPPDPQQDAPDTATLPPQHG